MKILVIGQPRSRSNFVLHSVAKFYNLENLVEPYGKCWDGPDYIANTKKVTSELLGERNFACKLQTSNISVVPDSYKYFQLTTYDAVFITIRKNITEQVASLLVAKTYDSWGTYPENPSVIKFDHNEHKFLLEEIEEDNKKVNIFKNYLIENNIHTKILYYETSEVWVRDNLGNPEVELKKSNYDYKKIISNYNELDDIVSQYFKLI